MLSVVPSTISMSVITKADATKNNKVEVVTMIEMSAVANPRAVWAHRKINHNTVRAYARIKTRGPKSPAPNSFIPNADNQV
jgi:hypothetical protein